VLAEQLLDGEAEGLVRKIIQKAKHGDVAALRICIDRILPPRRERPVRFTMPEPLWPFGKGRPRCVGAILSTDIPILSR
jgi:hypothetical protein